MVALLRPRCDNTTRHRPRPPPSSDSHHPNVKKMRSGFESSHYELLDPESLVSAIATELHEPSNKSKSGVLALLRPGCNVTHPRALASSGCKKKFKTRFGHSLLLAFQRAIANLFIDKKTAKFYEPPKSGIAVLLRPGCDVIPPRAVATSGCKELS